MHKEVFKIGSSKFDHNNISAIEAISLSVVAVLAISIGTVYGSLLF